jgi:hypothetical protein
VQNYHDSCAPDQERSGILPRLVDAMGLVGFSFGVGWSYGYDDGRDLVCVDQGLLRSCANLRLCGCVPTRDRVSPF